MLGFAVLTPTYLEHAAGMRFGGDRSDFFRVDYLFRRPSLNDGILVGSGITNALSAIPEPTNFASRRPYPARYEYAVLVTLINESAIKTETPTAAWLLSPRRRLIERTADISGMAQFGIGGNTPISYFDRLYLHV